MSQITIAERRLETEGLPEVIEEFGHEPVIVNQVPDEAILRPSIILLCGTFEGKFMDVLKTWKRLGKAHSGFLLITGNDRLALELNEIEQLTIIEKPISVHVARYRIDQALRHANQAS